MTFEHKLIQFLAKGDDLPEDVEMRIIEDFADSIPYGTLTGDEDTLDNWIFDNIELVNDFYNLPQNKLK